MGRNKLSRKFSLPYIFPLLPRVASMRAALVDSHCIHVCYTRPLSCLNVFSVTWIFVQDLGCISRWLGKGSRRLFTTCKSRGRFCEEWNEKATWHKIILPQCVVPACLPQSLTASVHCASVFTSKSYFGLLLPRICTPGYKVLTRHMLYIFTYFLLICHTTFFVM